MKNNSLKKYTRPVKITKHITYETLAENEAEADRLTRSGQCSYYPEAENWTEHEYGPITEVKK